MTGIAWSKRLVKPLVAAILVATTCVALGIWQIARLHQKQQFNAAVRAGLAAPPAAIDTLLPEGVDPEAVRYRRVEATGTFDTAHELILYGRTQRSQAGNHMLTPLRLDDGRAILVDRGWVPLDVDQPGAAAVAPPPGDVHVEGVLFSSDGGPPGVVGGAAVRESTFAKIDLEAIQSQIPYAIAPVYLLLRRQTPAQPDRFPRPAPLPELSEGPHLGYAVQWFSFAAIAAAGFVVLALRDTRDGGGADDDRSG
jgi:surfeit locus 1 family protein